MILYLLCEVILRTLGDFPNKIRITRGHPLPCGVFIHARDIDDGLQSGRLIAQFERHDIPVLRSGSVVVTDRSKESAVGQPLTRFLYCLFVDVFAGLQARYLENSGLRQHGSLSFDGCQGSGLGGQ